MSFYSDAHLLRGDHPALEVTAWHTPPTAAASHVDITTPTAPATSLSPAAPASSMSC